MHIKQIIISGFRSFRTQDEIEPFSPSHNVIVGRNGSGKSNFFDAIQFVLLAPRFASLRQEERQHLLHEGAGQNVMSAFVELIFDNSDGRIAVDGDEIVLRRTVGLKKDEFFLNRRRVRKGEVESLLESAGFSKSNPYYIVEQGKVNALCLMKDTERLNLLKEVAGTKVYEERREESNRIILETTEKREKIEEVISYIEERLDELEGEKEELKAYQQLDRDRRAIEYTIYDHDLRSAREELALLEAEVLEQNEENDSLYDKVYEVEEKLRDIEQNMQRLQERLRDKEDTQVPLRAELDAAMQHQEALDLEVSDLRERIETQAQEETSNSKLLEGLQAEEQQQRQELETNIEPTYVALKDEADELTSSLQTAKRRANALYQKQGRSAQYATAAERDEALGQQIEALRGELDERSQHLSHLESATEKTTTEQQELDATIQTLEAKNAEMTGTVKDLKARIREKTIERNEAAERRKENWRAIDSLEQQLRETRTSLEQSERELSGLLPRNVSQGLARLQEIVKAEGVPGVFGPIIDNIQLKDDTFRTAVEVAAKAQLFHVIVDTDETAAVLMERLEQEKSGRLTFLPLNRLRPRAPEYPDSPDVRPLIQVALDYPPRVEKAMQEVFGKKILARNMDVANEFSAKSNMDAITLDGDEVNRRGALYGGFHNQRESAILATMEVRKHRAELKTLEEKQAELRNSSLEQDVTVVMSDLNALETELTNQQITLSYSKQDLVEKRKQQKSLRETGTSKEKMIPHVRKEIANLEESIAALRAELGTDLKRNLSSAEQAELKALESDVEGIESRLPDVQHRYQEIALRREKIVAHLDHNLARRIAELSGDLLASGTAAGGQVTVTDLESQLSSRELDLQSSSVALEGIRKKLGQIDEEAKVLQNEYKRVESEHADLKKEQAELNEEVEDVDRKAQSAISRRQVLLEKRDESMRNVQNVGTVPAGELGHFEGMSNAQLLRQLRKVQKNLEKYSHVNKKALDQYVSFSEQRESLLNRKAELDEGASKIRELIDTLDQKKDEAILRTFQAVSKHFTEVFEELVPIGRGELIMQTKEADAQDSEESNDADDEEDDVAEVGHFSGVSVQVSFSGSADIFTMQELSGGQKALVALTLIFAIQRSDPAPFYLFDEIDQALDATHRAAVAALIEKQSHADENSAQFITTTFRPEMVEVADQCYGIGHQNKVSNIHLLTKDETLGFVASLEQEEAVEAPAEPERTRPKRGRRAASSEETENDATASNTDEMDVTPQDSPRSNPEETPTRRKGRARGNRRPVRN